jgi:hypothetical protein
MLAVAIVLFVAGPSRLTAVSFTVLIFVFNAAFLIVMANSITLVIDPHRTIAGMASSLYGFISQTVGSLLTLLTVPWINGDLSLWSLGQLCVTAIVLSAVMLYRPAPATSRS